MSTRTKQSNTKWSTQIELLRIPSNGPITRTPSLSVAQQDNIQIIAGGYGGSLESKLRHARGGLVTGDLSVTSTYAVLAPGTLSATYRHNVTGQTVKMVNTHGYIGGEPATHGGDAIALERSARTGAAQLILSKYLKHRALMGAVAIGEAREVAVLAGEYRAQAQSLYDGSFNVMERLLDHEARAARRRSNEDKKRRQRQRRKKQSRAANDAYDRKQRKRRASDLRRRLARIIDVAAGEWLKISFGLIPLFSDTSAAYDSFRKRLETSRPTKLRASVGRTAAKSATGASRQWSNSFDLRLTMQGDAQIDVLLKYVCLMRTELFQTPANTFGVTPRDILPTVYNLLPYTWLLDYFSNLGKMVEGFSHFVGYTTDLQETLVVKTRTRQWGSGRPTASTASYTLVGHEFVPGVFTVGSKRITRKLASGVSVPMPSFELSANLSDWKKGNLLAVGWAIARRNRLTRGVLKLLSFG